MSRALDNTNGRDFSGALGGGYLSFDERSERLPVLHYIFCLYCWVYPPLRVLYSRAHNHAPRLSFAVPRAIMMLCVPLGFARRALARLATLTLIISDV